MLYDQEITVSKKMFSKYKTITEAIQKAGPGTKIFIEPGLYHEVIALDKDIELIGKESADEIILYSESDFVLQMKTERAIVRGVTIQQEGEKKGDTNYRAIDVPMGSLTLEDCKVTSATGVGISIRNERAHSILQKCTISHNENCGIIVTDEGSLFLKDCKVFENKRNGIWTKERGSGTIENCDIYQNEYPNVCIEKEGNLILRDCKLFESKQSGIFIAERGKGTIENCEIYKNDYPNVSIVSGENPILRGCKIFESKQNGVWIRDRGKGTLESCDIYQNEYSNVCVEKEGNLTLKDCKIFGSKQNGLWVRDKGTGTMESCDIYQNGYPNVCIEKQGDFVLTACKIFEGKQHGVWVKENGKGTIGNCDIYKNEYANVCIESEGNPLFVDCRIFEGKENGVWVKDKGKGTIKNCEIYKNGYPNVGIINEGNPVFKDCKIFEGKQSGVFVTDKGKGTIENCDIYRNTYPNVSIAKEGNPLLKDCKIFESEDYGIWVREKGKGILENCKIEKNMKRDMVISEDSIVKIVSSTVTDKKEEKSQHESAQQPVLDVKEVLAQLDSFIGMKNVKAQIRKTIEYIQFNQEIAKFGLETEKVNFAAAHTVLYGNPGTGKTTVARLLGDLYKAMGLLPIGHVVQVNREKLVGKYIGQTAPKTKKKIDEAIGGILFIDEAYALSNRGSENDFGPEALEVILAEMENRKGEFMVVVAGYEQEMKQFLEINPGLQSRFTQYFHFLDYTPDELVEIAQKMVKEKKRNLSIKAEELLYDHFIDLWRKRDRFFANGRIVRNYIEGMLQAQAQRCMRLPKEQWSEELLRTLTHEDVLAVIPKREKKLFDLPINEKSLAEAMEKLNQMIGMNHVKMEIDKLITLVRFYKEEGKDVKELSPHTLLMGNPGTGKTEVARVIAKIYGALGILERGNVIEVNRDKLISPHSGGSEKLMMYYIEKAMGGTLFIDEAYQLTQYGIHDPGHKVVEVLLQQMENRQGDFILIVAGYQEKMEQFLESNDGLRKRFGRMIEFKDYTPSELIEISEAMLKEKGYRLDSEAHDALYSYYQFTYDNRDHTFANARLARNIVSEAIKNVNYRVAKIPKEKRTQEMKETISVIDMYLAF